MNPEKNLTIRRSYVHFQCNLPSKEDVKFAQLKLTAVRGITWEVFLANAKDVVKLYANGITSDSAVPVSNWLCYAFCSMMCSYCSVS